ncbi:MAG: hypothetical protein BWY37_02090 [Firmicutes bacterium ADurb.Bin262]|nr:MAG: hypothetical protein BWY37_02090 [Firmicutes bacterium ADurb.Bin262]
MRFTVFLCDIPHIRRRLEYKTVYPARGDIVDELRIVSVGGEHDFLAARCQRRKKLFVVRENVTPVPVRADERAGGPDDIVVHHHHRHVGRGKRVEILLNPGRVAAGHRAEGVRVRARRQQEHFPAEQVDQAGHAGHIDARHIHRVRKKRTVEAVMCLVLPRQFFLVPLAENLPGVEGNDFFRRLERAVNGGVKIDAAVGIDRVPHAGFHIAENTAAGQGAPQKIIVPGLVKGLLRPALDISGAERAHLDAGHRGDQRPVPFGRVFGSRDARRHLEVHGRHTVCIRHGGNPLRHRISDVRHQTLFAQTRGIRPSQIQPEAHQLLHRAGFRPGRDIFKKAETHQFGFLPQRR